MAEPTKQPEYTAKLKNGHTVLIVDHPALCQAFHDVLVYEGYTVYTANEIMEGLRIVLNQNDTLDLILLEMKTFAIDGAVFMERLPNCLVRPVGVIGLGFNHLSEAAFEQAPKGEHVLKLDFLPKPPDLVKMLLAVESGLGAVAAARG